MGLRAHAAIRRATRGGSWLFSVGVALALASCSLDTAVVPATEASPLKQVYEDARREGIPADATVAGSGFFIGPSTILTSAHVLTGCRSIRVVNAALGEVPARQLKVLAQNDAAVLAISALSGDVLALADEPAQGALTIVGFPARLPGNAPPARYRAAGYEFTASGLLLLGASVPAGMSGGPVVDEAGRALGVLAGRLNTGGHKVVASPLAAFRNDIARFQDAKPGRGSVDGATVKVLCR